ncbi:hypothetical protein E0Z10_g7013 [Xylaria hypoxylon]|uniref:Survival protein SurE-like phosphatase/nucleotidase domain-containing protein n=1 Tax=Xylaria hypoxylon TaxID=37992 RepID=A0A4Z0YNZ4_9PEZI|nr:hypothetical protein E0Z10_g7013 [Xylaria hypoxylon]
MHILVTNDDGPPGPASPYVHSLVRALQKAGHTVSVCLPDTQRSWIGKAHMIGRTVKPVYYRPPLTYDTEDDVTPQGTTHRLPSRGRDAVEEWVLVDGRRRLSGPNFGRNSTALFALSSGTLGAALEAAVCRQRAIALSYAHFKDRQNPKDPAVVQAATRHSVRVIEALAAQWPTDGSVDLYTVNVALLPGLESCRTIFTPMLQNYWGDGGTCFTEVEGSVGDEDEEEESIRGHERSGGSPTTNGTKTDVDNKNDENQGLIHRHFKWKPRFEDVYRSVEEAPPGNDGWAVKEGHTSVTPMKANFWQAASHLHGKELNLEIYKPVKEKPSSSLVTNESTVVLRPKDHFHALVAYEDAYVHPLIVSALQTLFPPESFTIVPKPADAVKDDAISLTKLLSNPKENILQITPYEAIDWDFVAAHPETCLVNSYMLRKALIRKHYLAATVDQWVAKRPESVLKDHVKRSEAFEVDYAEFLDDALVEAFDLRASLERNDALLSGTDSGAGENEGEGKGTAKGIEWWILKPGMSDRGQGIRLFCTMPQLQDIFDGWEAERPDSDDEGENGDEDEGDYIATSQLRHFVAQSYIDPPLLLPDDNRKFHIRTYVACVGGLDVYVYRQMLALFAGKPYVPPKHSQQRSSSSSSTDPHHETDAGDIDLEAHLTNTCLQRSVAENTVQPFWDLPLSSFPSSSASAKDAKTHIFDQICEITGEVFEAAARTMQMHFRPLGNAFEIFGLDFLVDAAGHVYLLEVNAFPDFRQTGDELKDIVAGLWREVLGRAVRGFFGGGNGGESDEQKGELVLVRRVDFGW